MKPRLFKRGALWHCNASGIRAWGVGGTMRRAYAEWRAQLQHFMGHKTQSWGAMGR